MKMKAWMSIAVVAVLPTLACAQAPKTDKEKLGYSIGIQMGNQINQMLKRDQVDVDPEAFSLAIKDVLAGNKPAMTDEEIKATLTQFQQNKMKEFQELADKNKKESEAFLAANKGKEGVVTLPSGVQYKVIQAGKGKKPTAKDSVVAHYTGTLPNGKEFDNSLKRGQPATFPLESVIPGWKEVLPLMQEGAKWQVVIPSEHAYGARGFGQDIGPNQALVFEIELIEVKKQTTPPAAKSKKAPSKPAAPEKK